MLAILVTIPLVLYYRSQSEKIGCVAALDTATRQMADKFLIDGFKDASEVKAWVTLVMNGWDDLCPGGGNVYIIHDESAEMPWRLVCGMHGEDKKECCRLNASWALGQVREAVKKAADDGKDPPEKIEIPLNGKTLEVKLTDKRMTDVTRGTGTMMDYDGTVAFYAVAGYGDEWRSTGASSGTVCYFCFADPNYCASWLVGKGWTGDAYS